MSCRETKMGSAVTSYVKISENLAENQSITIFHELMRESRGVAIEAPTHAEKMEFLNDLATQIEADTNLSPARRRSLLSRLDQAATETIDPAVFYAATRTMERGRRASVGLREYYAGAARTLGISEAEVANRVSVSEDETRAERGLRAPAAWVRDFHNRPENRNLPMDRHTAYAIWRLENDDRDGLAAVETRPTIQDWVATPQSSAIDAYGYSADTGRLEVRMRSNPDRSYAYQVPPQVFREFADADSVGTYFTSHIRGNRAFQYANAEAHNADAVRRRCGSCGQWAARSHSCPVVGSAEERELIIAQVRTLNRVTRAREAVASGTHAQRVTRLLDQGVPHYDAERQVLAEDDLARQAPESVLRRTQGQRLVARVHPYRGDSGTMRVTALSTVKRLLASETLVEAPVGAHITAVAGPDGTRVPVTPGEVTGRVAFTGNAASGYTAVVEPGTERSLRCTCADYRARYDCVHVRQTIADLNTRMNQSLLRTPHGLGEQDVTDTLMTVRADIEAETAAAAVQTEAVVAAAAARAAAPAADPAADPAATDGEDAVSYVEDMAAFQRLYRDTRARRDAGEAPIEYMTENATGGLARRDGGRGFGVELEFDLDPSVNRSAALAAIARDLHAAGLTSSARQVGYHSSSSRGYTTEHRGGWSFESDCTVAGELVSPIMYDTPETWENLATACDIIKRHGGVVSQRAGSHIHVSAADYDHTVDNHTRLLGLAQENEDLMYRVSSNPERGRHRSTMGNGYSRPNNPVPAAGYRSINDVRYANGHGNALNFQSVVGRDSDHVEFRMWDATLDPATIQAQVNVSLAMTDFATANPTYQPAGRQPLGARRAYNRETFGQSRRLTGEDWKADTSSARKFADTVMPTPAMRKQFLSLFSITRWQRGGR